MLNYPFNKNYNTLPLTVNLRDYIKKANRDSFNNYIKKSTETKLQYSLMNYRNYSDTFLNNKNTLKIYKLDIICAIVIMRPTMTMMLIKKMIIIFISKKIYFF